MAHDQSTILVVDDTELNRILLNRLLGSIGHRTILASSGEEALTAIEAELPDLILLDIVMPEMDGVEVLERIKSDPVFQAIPVIMITALSDIENVVKCIQFGAEDYMLKPFDFTLLKARIDGALEKRNALLKARKLGSYTIERKIGEGGMADVHLASHAMLRRPTAIKILRRQQISERIIELFEREVQVTAQLSHPNTIAIYDYGRTPDGWFYYAMEYLDGVNLRDLLEVCEPLPESRIIHILMQACDSLEEAHDNGLIHRDIKPSNIMLCKRGGIHDVAKVLDFGIVENIAERDVDAGEGNMRLSGTPPFMSPEAIEAPHTIDARSDLYALGAVGYFLLTGEFLFDAIEPRVLLMAHVNEIPMLPSKRRGRAVSADLEQVIMRCLEKDKDLRPASAYDLRVELGKCQDSGKWGRKEAAEWWSGHLAETHSLRAVDASGDGEFEALEIDLTGRSKPAIGPGDVTVVTDETFN